MFIGKRAFLGEPRHRIMIGSPSGPGGMSYDFGTGTLPPGMTFTRASAAWGFNAKGGNLMQNPFMAGAVVGTPGSSPTGWLTGGATTGITRTVVSTGIEDGIHYIELQYAGTPAGTTFFTIEMSPRTNGVSAVAGQTFVGGFYCRLTNGSLTNTTLQNRMLGMNAAAAITDAVVSTPFSPTGAGLASQRFLQSLAIVDVTTVNIVSALRVNTTAGMPIDFTIRIGEPSITSASVPASAVLVPYDTNDPRFVYDPATLQNLGLLVEGARTNSVRNSTCVGAVPGTPGTVPTRWSASSTANNVTREIVGSGIEDGIEYVDFRYFGTPSVTSSVSITFESSLQTAAADGQTWTGSYYYRLAGGSMTNVSALGGFLSGRDGAGSGVNSLHSGNITPTSAALRTQRKTWTHTLVGATITGVDHDVRVGYTIALPIDITLRIGLPQLELGEGVSSPIKTSTVAVTRALDSAALTDPRAFTDKAWIIAGRTASFSPTASTWQVLQHNDDGGFNNRFFPHRRPDNTIHCSCIVGGTATSDIVAGTVANNTDFKLGARYALDSFAASLNGAAVVTDTSGAVPASITAARVGREIGTALHWNSTIRSIETRATASDAELVALSTLP